MIKDILKKTIDELSKGFDRIVLAFMHQPRQSRFAIFGSAGILVIAAVLAVTLLPRPAKAEESMSAAAELTAGNVASQGIVAAASQATPTPLPTSSPTPTPDPTLKRGDESDRVQQLQERLMELDYMDLDESTKFFGPATEYAVQLFQRQHNLDQDGIAGSDTLNLLFSDQAKKYTLLEGTSGNDVNSLQQQLVDLGYLGKVTGYYGSETLEAVKAFQSRNGLSVDGKTGEQTLSLIYSPEAVQSEAKIKEALRTANVKTMLEVAEAQLGDPYILGATGPKSFDCSGLVYYCLKQAGSSRSRFNAAGYSRVSDWEKITSMSDLQPGDLLFFSTNGKSVGHTGIYIGDGMMIDASSSNGEVVKRSCTTSFWQRNFVCGRRPW